MPLSVCNLHTTPKPTDCFLSHHENFPFIRPAPIIGIFSFQVNFTSFSAHADRQRVDKSFRAYCLFVCLFLCNFVHVCVCTVTDFSGEDKASGVKFCTVLQGRPGQEISDFGKLCSPRSRKLDESDISGKYCRYTSVPFTEGERAGHGLGTCGYTAVLEDGGDVYLLKSFKRSLGCTDLSLHI